MTSKLKYSLRAFSIATIIIASTLIMPFTSQAVNPTWILNSSTVNTQQLAISDDYINDNTIFAGDLNGRIFKSTNAGTGSWITSLDIVTTNDIRQLASSPNYSSDGTVFAAVQSMGVYRTFDGGATWNSTIESGNRNSYSVAMSRDFHRGVAGSVFVGVRSGIWRSTDYGINWTFTSLSDTTIRALAFSPDYNNDHTVFAGTAFTNSGTVNHGVYKSTDSGVGFAESNGVFPSDLPTTEPVLSLAVAPSWISSDTVFAGTGDGVYRSDDSGSSWTRASTGIPAGNDINSLAISESFLIDRMIFASTVSGVYISTDRGVNWTLVGTDLTTNVPSLVLSNGYDQPTGEIFAGNANGLYRNQETDLIEPVTIFESTGTLGDNSWYTGDTTITLTRNEPGTTYYKWNSDAPQTYTGPFIPPSGSNTLSYWSVDFSGNAETPGTETVKFDEISPVDPSAVSTSHATGIPSNDTTVDVLLGSITQATDDASGIAGYSVLWDTLSSTLPAPSVNLAYSGTTQSFTGPPLSGNNNYLHLRTKDNAGHWTSTVHLGPFEIDTAPPSTSIVITGTPGDNSWYISDTTVTLTRNEQGTTFYRWSSDVATSSTSAPTVNLSAPAGSNTLTYYSVDTATNIEVPTLSQPVKVYTTAPASIAPVTDDGAYTTSTAELSAAWSASSDGQSGILNYEYSIGTTAGAADVVGWTDNVLSTSFTRAGLTLVNGSTYYINARAGNGAGIYSPIVSSDGISVDTAAPAIPGLVGLAPSTTAVNLYWLAAADNIGVAGYRIFDAGDDSLITTVASTNHNFTGLNPSTTYGYYLKAVDAAGNTSGASNIVTIKPGGGGNTPGNGSSEESITVTPASNVSITYPDTDCDGTTTIALSSIYTNVPPVGYKFFENEYEITHSSGCFDVPVIVAVKYDETDISGSENDIKIFHKPAGQPIENVTLYVDTVNNIAVGRLYSLSPVILAEPATPVTGLNQNILLTLAMLIIGMGLLIIRKFNFR